ncbi:ATP-binding cassette domain-containing protein [Actinotignum urinale]|uniref:ABC transporter ATP-binding protein n=1 Tax=Actinotignum urinale TaxID=190146 RepID=UPI002543E1F0|nr:ATP-binding cassette domain-containing protein [Actinotignum urinale]WIK59483.1 ATP-binding cassette domain-containing protein [Actinotignum urinale]
MDASASQGILEKGSTVTLSGKIVANEGVPAGSLRNGLGVYGAGVDGAGVDGAGAGVDSARVGSGDASGAGTDALADSSGSASDEVVIDFSHITFGYGNDPDVLRDVSFTVRRGEKIAFVSESGGGKTTLTSLLLGLYEPRHGKIFVDGKNIGDMTPIDVRSRIGVVFQDAALFSGTVRENIAYGRPEASDEEIHDAAQRAHADRFIRRFKDGYDTVIGERGLKLSGGQRQRIAVARALLKGAEILILDEATSALDTRSERWVQAGLEELMKNRTSIIIAHRLSTIATVDRIITLRDGKIDEVGSPAELAVSGGIYSELLALQNEGSAQARKHLRRYGFR